MYDVAIIGAGPAGATLARILGDSLKVLLLEKRRLNMPPQQRTDAKVCGGLLAPDAQKMLAGMALGLPKDVLVGPQLFVVRTIDFASGLERYYQRFYLNLDREKFDRWLVSLLPHTVDMRCGSLYKSFKQEDNGYRVTFSNHNKTYEEKARVLIGADGALSKLRHQVFPHGAWPHKYIAIQEWFQAEGESPYFSTIFDPEITDFYAWTVPKEGSIIVGAALSPGKDALVKFAALKDKLKNYGYKLGKGIRKEGAFISRPVRNNQVRLGIGNILFIGEAAGWISPSSAEGFSYAFRSALMAAEAILQPGKSLIAQYKRNSFPLRSNIIWKNQKAQFMYKSGLRRLIMQSAVLSMDISKTNDVKR